MWDKPNGLPESVTDRVRRSHEQWFHFTKAGRYYSAIDELREPQRTAPGREGANCLGGQKAMRPVGPNSGAYNPLGKIPGSVWAIPSEPLTVPDEVGVDHFAAFPTEWPRRLILGWSPAGICTACGEGRAPIVDVEQEKYRDAPSTGRPHRQSLAGAGGGFNNAGYPQTTAHATITGYACACPSADAPTTPAVVLDPFGGTGTVAMVAAALGRTGISVDLSGDYCRLAQWRINNSDHDLKAIARTSGPAAAASISEQREAARAGQGTLL